MRRAGPVLLVACACDGGHALAQGFGEAMALAALILLGLTIAAALAYVVFWTRLVRAMRRALGPGGDASAAVRGWLWGLMVVLVHGAAILLLSRWRYGEGPEAAALVLAAFVPLAALAVLAGLAARRGRWWPVAPTAALVVCAGGLALENWRSRELEELPGRVVEVSAVILHGCARLVDRARCRASAPTGTASAATATSTAPTAPRWSAGSPTPPRSTRSTASAARCGPSTRPTCWGGGDALPVPGPRERPWTLPGAREATALAIAPDTIVWLERGGRLGGWPRPPPEGLRRARVLVGDGDFDGGWSCALDEAGALACWPEDPPAPRTPRWFAGPPAVTLAVDADAEVACAGDERGTVRCYDLDRDAGLLRTVELPGLEQLLAVDDDGTFCGRQGRRVTCWRGSEAAHVDEGFASVDAVFAGAGLLCGVTGEARTCRTPGEEPSRYIEFIAHDRRP